MFKNLKRLLFFSLIILFSPFLRAQAPWFAVSTNPFYFFAGGGNAAVEFGFCDFSFTASYLMFKTGLYKNISPKVSARTSMIGVNYYPVLISESRSQYLPFFGLRANRIDISSGPPESETLELFNHKDNDLSGEVIVGMKLLYNKGFNLSFDLGINFILDQEAGNSSPDKNYLDVGFELGWAFF